MERNLCIAISGTPGCGKTSLAEMFSNNGVNVFTVKQLAKQHECLSEENVQDGASEIDIHKLAELWQNENNGLAIIDGHLSHFLDVDGIILLRCNPKELAIRLSKRDYSAAKINSNVEWELISGTWSEILEFEIDIPIMEFDTTEQTSEEIFQQVSNWIDENIPDMPILEQSDNSIDWMKE